MRRVTTTAAAVGAATALVTGLAPAASAETSSPEPQELQAFSEHESLRDVAPGDVVIGTAVAGGGHHLEQDYPGLEPGQSPFLFDDEYREHLAEEFSSLSPENQMKWEFLHPEQGRYDFTEADAVVEFAEEHGQAVRGHTLLWHSQNPDWLEEGDFTPEQLREILRDHITTVVGRYAGRIQQWDVANEIFDEQGQLRTEDNIWIRELGPGIVADAFRWAHEADPEALLFFNDYGAESVNEKSDAYYALARELLEQDVPVHGFSVQSHLSTRFGFPDDLQANLARFDALGLETAVTEVDVRMDLPAGATPTRAQLEQQADYYRRALEACLGVESCNSFTVWGFTDKYSWVPVFFPDQGAANIMWEDYSEKPAYYELLETLASTDVALACPAEQVPTTGFTDIAGVNAQFHRAIECLAALGITRGTATAGRYDPDGSITRVQMAQFLHRVATLAGVDLGTSAGPFTDLDGLSEEGRAAVNALRDAGVVQGRTATTYEPQGSVTRGQMASFLARFSEHVLGEALPGTDTDAFGDDEASPHEAAINRIAAAGIASGVAEGQFAPSRAVTRAQMAAFVARHLQVAMKAGLLPPLLDDPNAEIVTSTWQGGRTVSLTFDDGPDPEDTPRLLDVLEEHGVQATFCLWGEHVQAHPELVRDIAAAGHILCNHTVRHDDMAEWTPEQVRADLEVNSAIIREAVPGAEIPYFRAPFGAWGQTPQVAAGLGMQPLGWRLVIGDWEPPGTDVLVQRLREGVTPGAVVLAHDGGGDRSQTVEAIDQIIPELEAAGYRFDRPAPVG